MKNIISGYIGGFLCGFFLFLLGHYIFLKDPNGYSEITTKNDTVTVVRYDTIVQYKPEYISERVVDTVYVETKDSIFLPFEIKQRYFKEDGLYELWVSGIMPELDKITVYPKTVYKNINSVEIHKIYANSWRGYIGGSLSASDGMWVPSLEITLTTPKLLYIKAGVGIIDRKPIYTFGTGVRIFGK